MKWKSFLTTISNSPKVLKPDDNAFTRFHFISIIAHIISICQLSCIECKTHTFLSLLLRKKIENGVFYVRQNWEKLGKLRCFMKGLNVNCSPDKSLMWIQINKTSRLCISSTSLPCNLLSRKALDHHFMSTKIDEAMSWVDWYIHFSSWKY